MERKDTPRKYGIDGERKGKYEYKIIWVQSGRDRCMQKEERMQMKVRGVYILNGEDTGKERSSKSQKKIMWVKRGRDR